MPDDPAHTLYYVRSNSLGTAPGIGSCVDYYGARDRLAVGQPGSVPILQQSMCAATKVVTF